MNLPIFHLNKSIVSNPTNHHSPSRHNTDEQHKDYLFKKYLRGKLVKLINHSIIREDQPSSDSVNFSLYRALMNLKRSYLSRSQKTKSLLQIPSPILLAQRSKLLKGNMITMSLRKN